MTNKRLEQKLIALAYGELDSREVETVRNAMDSNHELRKLFEAYQMAATASATPELFPPPSLSSDRLRQAILANELKPDSRPFLSRFGFGIASVAAAFFAIAVVPKMLQSPGLNLHDNKPVAINNAVESVTPSVTTKTPKPATVTATVQQPKTITRSNRKPNLYASNDKPRANKNVTKVSHTPVDLHDSIAGIAGGAAAAGVERDDADSVIVISTGSVSEGSKATEMKSPTGVPIGG